MQKKQTQIRMYETTRRRVRKYIEKFEKDNHAKIGFSEAIRVLLDVALKKEGIQ
jgi:hypothetical protein